MNILKSLGVLIYIVLIVFASVRSVLKCKDAYESSEPYIGKTILTGFLCLLALTSLMKFPLLNPFDRNVKFEPYATLEIPPENTLQTPHFWTQRMTACSQGMNQFSLIRRISILLWVSNGHQWTLQTIPI